MIIVKIRGGLGNQLFQYAAGKALAEYHKVELKLDLNAFSKNTSRKYELVHFNITALTATREEINSFTFENKQIYVRYWKKLSQKIKPYYLCSVYTEPHFHFDQNFFKAPGNVYLSGYWQSEKYFNNIVPTIFKEFQIVSPQGSKNVELLKTIQKTNSVCIHVRRGDYVSNTHIRNYHGLCGLDFYNKAMEQIKNTIESPHFFVFSDDIEWVQLNLKISDPVNFVDNNKEETAYEDYRLMSSCKHHIIANSSFSWWAARLSENRNKIVIAPKQWFKTKEHDTKDLIPESWLTV